MSGINRYEWPELYGVRHTAPSPSVAPAIEAPPAAVASSIEHVADGEHLGMRWYVTRQADALHPVVTVQGWDGPHYVTETRDMEGASVARVKRWVEQLVASRKAAADAKNARKTRR